jgi:hypothetical protein
MLYNYFHIRKQQVAYLGVAESGLGSFIWGSTLCTIKCNYNFISAFDKVIIVLST